MLTTYKFILEVADTSVEIKSSDYTQLPYRKFYVTINGVV
jgi:hypothetical protein